MPHPKKVGNDFERQIAKILSEWFTGGKEDLVVWRNPHSGSLGTKRVKNGLLGNNVDGDLQCLDLTYKKFFDTFYMDTKSYSEMNWCFINKANQKSNKLLNEWKKVLSDAEAQKKIGMMLVKIRDGKTPLLIFLPSSIPTNCDNMITETQCVKFQIILLDDFLKNNPDWEKFILELSVK